MRISDWSSDVCSSDLGPDQAMGRALGAVDHHDLGRDPARPAMVRTLWRCLRVSGADRPDRALAGVAAGRPAEDELFTLRFLVDARHRPLEHAARAGRLSDWSALSAGGRWDQSGI